MKYYISKTINAEMKAIGEELFEKMSQVIAKI